MQDAWATLNKTCAAGLCKRHSNTSLEASNTTDCKTRMLMYEFGLTLIPAMSPQREVFDALELQSCGVHPPPFARRPANFRSPAAAPFSTFFVDFARGSDSNAGSAHAPFKTILHGVETARTAPKPASLILASGVHFLSETIDLGAADSGLTITAAEGGDDVWVSGGSVLETSWKKVSTKGKNDNIWVTDVSKSVTAFNGLNTLGDGKTLRRVTKARYPNGDPETCTNCWMATPGAVTNWQADVSCIGKAKVVYKDLRNCVGDTGKLPDGSPCKADSAMWDTYNTFSNGECCTCCTVCAKVRAQSTACAFIQYSYFASQSTACAFIQYSYFASRFSTFNV
jgi:hypothetical protein